MVKDNIWHRDQHATLLTITVPSPEWAFQHRSNIPNDVLLLYPLTGYPNTSTSCAPIHSQQTSLVAGFIALVLRAIQTDQALYFRLVRSGILRCEDGRLGADVDFQVSAAGIIQFVYFDPRPVNPIYESNRSSLLSRATKPVSLRTFSIFYFFSWPLNAVK